MDRLVTPDGALRLRARLRRPRDDAARSPTRRAGEPLTAGRRRHRPVAAAARRCCCCTASRRGRSCTERCSRCSSTTGHRVVAPTSSASVAATSPPTATSTPTPGTSSGSARRSSTASGSTASRSSARTGAACSDSGSSPSTPSAFARVAVGNTGLPTGDGAPGERSSRGRSTPRPPSTFDVGRIVSGGLRDPARRRSGRRLRRALPRGRLQGGPAPAARPRAHDAKGPRLGGQPRGLGRARSGSSDRSCAATRTATRSRGARTAGSSSGCPAPRARPTRRSRAGATSSRRIAARSWARCSPGSSLRRLRPAPPTSGTTL